MVVKKLKKKLLRIPAVMNSRFLLALLKVVIHGNIGNSKLAMVDSLLKLVDTGAYIKDLDIYVVIKALEISINCKTDDVKDNHLIMTLIEASISNAESADIISGLIEPIVLGAITLQEQEVTYVLGVVSTYSKVGFLLNYKDSITDKFTHIESGSMGGIQNIVNDFEKEIAELHMKLHKTLSSDSLNTMEPVSISGKDFMSTQFNVVYKMAKRKTRALKTGIKRFNQFLSEDEGFLTGKMYLINAPTNTFKTSLLLYIAKWIQQYNSDLYLERFKATGKRPTILIASLENTWDENMERLFSIFSGKNMSDVTSLEQAENIWKTCLYKTNSIIDIVLIYGKSGRFSPADLEYRIDELESQGCQVITTIVDYLKVMRDDLGDVDPRLRVMNISKDLHEIVAVRPEMVLITAHHTNREGDKVLTDVEDRGGVDKVKSLGRQHLTESNSIEEAPDFSMYINPEVSPYTGDSYLTLKKGRCRYKRTSVDYFAHQLKNRFFLTDDIYMEKSLSIDSIAETAQEGPGEKKVYSNDGRSGDKGRISTREVSSKKPTAQIFDVIEVAA